MHVPYRYDFLKQSRFEYNFGEMRSKRAKKEQEVVFLHPKKRKWRLVLSFYSNELNLFDSLHEDLLISIIAALSASSNSPLDLVNAKLTCKRFCSAASDPKVLKCASIGALTAKASKSNEQRHNFLRLCAEAGNREAIYMLPYVIIDILNNHPHSEALRPSVLKLLKVAIHVLNTDNEESGLICMRITFDFLRNYSSTIEPEVQPSLDFAKQVKESKRLVKCFLNYLRHNKTEVGVLFDMLSIFLVRTCIDYTFLKEFYMIEVAEGYNPQMKKTLLVHFLNLFQSKELSQDHLVVSMQMLILPMLAHTFQNNQSWDVVDASIIKTIVEKLLGPPEEVSAEYIEPLRIELLQLSTLLLKYLPNYLVHHRKKLISFGWNHLKPEDSATRPWALVNVCHFLEAYQAPERIILQVFVVLLKTCQPENKVLVKQALDILMPALPRRLPVGECKTPIWIHYTLKILLEEGHSLLILIHIFQLIVRHSDLFYSFRAQFVPHMVDSLSRLGLPQNTPSDNRRLAIELAGCLVGWEKQRQAESKTVTDSEGHALAMDMSIAASVVDGELSGAATISKRASDNSGFADDSTKRAKTESGLSSLGVMSPSGTSIKSIGTAGAAAQPDEEYKPNAAMEEMIINFLIQVALATEPKDKEMSAMYKQALDLLSQALEVWPTANIKFNSLEKLLSLQPSGQDKDPSAALVQGLDVMNKVLEKQPHLFI